MPEHKCPNEALINQCHKELYGNGNPGMVKDFVEIKTRFEKMDESVDKLATAFSALAKSDSNREAVRKALGKALVKASLIVGIAGTIVALILKFA